MQYSLTNSRINPILNNSITHKLHKSFNQSINHKCDKNSKNIISSQTPLQKNSSFSSSYKPSHHITHPLSHAKPHASHTQAPTSHLTPSHPPAPDWPARFLERAVLFSHLLCEPIISPGWQQKLGRCDIDIDQKWSPKISRALKCIPIPIFTKRMRLVEETKDVRGTNSYLCMDRYSIDTYS